MAASLTICEWPGNPVMSKSGKAILIETGRGERWVPKSLCVEVPTGPQFAPDLALPLWFCHKEGITPAIKYVRC